MEFTWTTKSVKEAWASPDGKVTIYTIVNDKAEEMKTMSKVIATVGWSGTVQQYINPKGNAYLRQPPKEGFAQPVLADESKTPEPASDMSVQLDRIEQKLEEILAKFIEPPTIENAPDDDGIPF